MSEDKKPEKFARLRELALKDLRHQSAGIVGEIAALSPEERSLVVEDVLANREHTINLIHELWVHQTELEMQHNHLVQAQELLCRERDRYAALYNNAPVGYLSTTRHGKIIEINTMGARLLGAEQFVLMQQSLKQFIVPDDQDIYHLHLRHLFASMLPQTCELRIQQRRDGAQFYVRLESNFARGAHGIPHCHTAMLDITERVHAEQALQWQAQVGQNRIAQPEAVLPQAQEDFFSDMPYVQEKYEEGVLVTLHGTILDILQMRFSPPAEQVQQMTAALDQVAEEVSLRVLLRAAVQTDSLEAFQAALHEQRRRQTGE
jgi:PAS domain S-box-containing protein